MCRQGANGPLKECVDARLGQMARSRLSDDGTPTHPVPDHREYTGIAVGAGLGRTYSEGPMLVQDSVWPDDPWLGRMKVTEDRLTHSAEYLR